MKTPAYLERLDEKTPSLDALEIPTDGLGVIYFLGNEDESDVRIGFEKNGELKRPKAHESYGYSTPLAYIRGTQANEQSIHSFFGARGSNVAKKGREHHRTEAVIAYITWLRDQYYVAISPHEWQTRVKAIAIESTAWLPSEHTVSARRRDDLLSGMKPWGFLPEREITGDDYYTPEEIIIPVRNFLGTIDLDPASHVYANAQIRASRFFTMGQNGLTQPWSGRVWLNPPFGAWPDFVAKTLDEFGAQRVTEIVLLAATRTMTANYFAELLKRADAMCVITGRFGFWGVSNASTPPDGHFLTYLGPRRDAFKSVVGSALGPVFFGS